MIRHLPLSLASLDRLTTSDTFAGTRGESSARMRDDVYFGYLARREDSGATSAITASGRLLKPLGLEPPERLIRSGGFRLSRWAGYMPVPVRLTLCGLLGSCGTLTESDPLRAPEAVGLKSTTIGQLEFPAKVGPHPPTIEKSAVSAPPIKLATETVNGDLLVTVVWSALEDD